MLFSQHDVWYRVPKSLFGHDETDQAIAYSNFGSAFLVHGLQILASKDQRFHLLLFHFVHLFIHSKCKLFPSQRDSTRPTGHLCNPYCFNHFLLRRQAHAPWLLVTIPPTVFINSICSSLWPSISSKASSRASNVFLIRHDKHIRGNTD